MTAADERYVVLGLGTPRSRWFTEVARWATSGALPVELVKCIAVDEMRTRLASGRRYSALVVDAATGAVDRDLLEVAAAHEVAVVVVDGGPATAWRDLGVAAVLAPDLGRAQLVATLAEHCRTVAPAVEPAGDHAALPVGRSPGGAAVVAVTGPGGTGASTVAMALAQGAADPGRRVVLADLRLDAALALLHGAPDVVPGLPELVEAHRRASPPADEVRALTFDVPARGYRLLLGLRRHRDWAALRPRRVEAAVAGLRTACDLLVVDVDADVEGEVECGVVEVEERNVLARTTTSVAHVVVVVGAPGLAGVHALVRTIAGLVGHGVEPLRIVPVVARAPRALRARAEISRAVADLVAATGAGPLTHGLVHLPERRGVESALRDGTRLPEPLCQPIARAVADLLDRPAAHEAPTAAGPVPITPAPLRDGIEQGVGA